MFVVIVMLIMIIIIIIISITIIIITKIPVHFNKIFSRFLVPCVLKYKSNKILNRFASSSRLYDKVGFASISRLYIKVGFVFISWLYNKVGYF